jgi:glycosyltransferase involved in cell wall biosynthesis
MTVLHVIPSIAAVHGGPSIMLERMARGLSQTGIDIHVATTDDNGDNDGARRLEIPHGVPVVRDGVTYWYFTRQTRFYKFSRPLSAWLAKHITDYQIVHIHALFSHAAFAAAYWAHRRRVPYVVRPLGTLNRWGMENRRPWLKQLSFRLIERRILENAALVHYTSEQERVEAELLNVRTRSEIIPNPVPDQGGESSAGRFRAAHPDLDGREIILFLSRFDRKKGLDLLLPAFARVREQFPSAALVLAGSGNSTFVKSLQAQAETLGIAKDIFWPGFLKGDEKRAAFADATVFVLPSWSENFGIAVVEAMSAGCPVVVSDQVAIHTDIAAARAGCVVPCAIEPLAEALCRMLADRPARAAMGFNGKCLTETHYSIETVTSKLVAAYNAALSLSSF